MISSDYGGFSTSTPSHTVLSLYLWDAIKNGKLFHSEIYTESMFLGFVNRFVESAFEGVVIPSQFSKTRVFNKFAKNMTGGLKQSRLVDSLESVDPSKVKSVRQLVEEIKQKGEEQLNKTVEFLKQDMFPPTLWMELSRLAEVFVDCMMFMVDRIENLSKMKPKRKSQIKERSRLVKWMFRPHFELAKLFFEAFLRFERLYLFMELISCEHESELFTEKLWTFKREHYKNLEPILFDLHNSTTALQQTLLESKPKEITIDFSKPTGWAFKQLVQTVVV